MSLDTARKAIDLVINLGQGSACVSYFGGEPLLMFDRIVELTSYAQLKGQQAGKQMHFRLSTNGTLFTEEQLAFCRDNNVLFALSLDGDEQAHDSQRVQANGQGSFHLIDSKLDMMLKYNPYTVVTSVITPQTAPRLFSSMQYMWSRGLRFIVHQLDYRHPDWTPEHFEILEQQYRKLASFYLDKVRAGEHFHMGLIEDKLKTHTSSPIVLGEICDFGAKKISIAPDGRIFPCVQFISDKTEANAFCIGDVDNGLNDRREQLIAKNKQQRNQCGSCALMGRCSNYCGCVNWQVTGEVTEVPAILCSHERMLIPIVDEIGNELWAEGNQHFLQKHYKDYEQRFPYHFD